MKGRGVKTSSSSLSFIKNKINMGKIIKDWFNRRAEDAYTFADDSKRLFNWDKNRSSYSSYFLKDDSFSNASQMIGSIFSVLGVPKHASYVSHVQKDVGKSDGISINVPLKMLKDKDGQYQTDGGKTLDAFYGVSIQNAALAAMQTDDEYIKTLQARDTTSSGSSVKNLLFSVLNTERIDKKLADRFPGYLKFVQAFKNHQYEGSSLSEESSMGEDKQKRLLKLLVKLLRYPGDVSEAEMEEFKEPISQMEKLLKKHGGIPDSFTGCKSMSNSLANIVTKYTEKEEEEEKGPGEPDPDSDPDSDETGEDDPEKREGGGTPPKSEKSKGLSKEDLDKFAKELLEETMEPEMEATNTKDDVSDFEEFVEGMEKKDYPKDLDSDNLHVKSPINFIKADSDKEEYMRVLGQIEVSKAAVLKKLFERKSKDQAFVMKSMRTGRLDTNKIAEATQNVDTIYEKMGHISTNKVCVGVLIDESGSMSGKRIEKARQAAVFINEVFKSMPDVELFIYGHTADEPGTVKNPTSIRVYREPGSLLDKWALGSVEARYNNRDGDAILAVAQKIRKRTQNQGIMFVISDGQPAARNYGGNTGILDTRKKVTLAQSLGFQVIQIAIETEVPSAQMFDYYIKMTDIKNLPRDLANYMSKKIDKLIREKVTM